MIGAEHDRAHEKIIEMSKNDLDQKKFGEVIGDTVAAPSRTPQSKLSDGLQMTRVACKYGAIVPRIDFGIPILYRIAPSLYRYKE